MKKLFSICLVLFIILFSVNVQYKEAQAFFVVDDMAEVALVTAVLEEAGATGTVVAAADGGFAGSLYTSAVNLFYELTPDIQAALQRAVGLAYASGYLDLSTVTGTGGNTLTSELNQHLTAQDYVASGATAAPITSSIPTVTGSSIPSRQTSPTIGSSIDYTNVDTGCILYTTGTHPAGSFNVSMYNSVGTLIVNGTYANPTLVNLQIVCTSSSNTLQMQSFGPGNNNSTSWHNVGSCTVGSNNHYYIPDLKFTVASDYSCTITANGVTYTPYWFNTAGYLYDTYNAPNSYSVSNFTNNMTSNGNTVYAPAVPQTNQKVAIPYDPTQLSNGTATTSYINTAGVTSTPIASTTATNTSDAAAAAGQAAYNAAKALGLSDAQAQAAAKAASAAIAAGLTSAQAASAGAQAATNATTATNVLTTDIANPKTGDTINWTPLNLASDAFTNKFPFSLPWDFLHMVQTFASPPAVTPTFSIVGDSGVNAGFKVNSTMNLSQFNDAVASVRIFEKIVFCIGLLYGTRKLLGGDV